mmetsp:Transcript_37864/g.122156  ORF Transcript_37864/g.122156 Transcript_37864/m.122156 type:complete len:295 (-) Transcript_37864:176-1060(-)
MQQRVKAFAHSPHLPLRVCSSLAGWLYRGKRVTCPVGPRYSSTRPAPHAFSSPVGSPIPMGSVGWPVSSHSGALTHVKKSRLNHRRSSLSSASSGPPPAGPPGGGPASSAVRRARKSPWLALTSSSSAGEERESCCSIGASCVGSDRAADATAVSAGSARIWRSAALASALASGGCPEPEPFLRASSQIAAHGMRLLACCCSAGSSYADAVRKPDRRRLCISAHACWRRSSSPIVSCGCGSGCGCDGAHRSSMTHVPGRRLTLTAPRSASSLSTPGPRPVMRCSSGGTPVREKI